MKNLPKITVISDISGLATTQMVSQSKGIKFTGDPDATTPPVDDMTLHGAADTLLNIHTARQANPPTKTADDETMARDTLALDYQADALYVQTVANKVAKAAGDVAAGIIVVQRLGFTVKKVGTRHTPTFEVFKAGPGWAHLRTKSAGKKAAYIWRYGITDRKGNPPIVFGHVVVNLEANILINGLKSGTVIGIQYAAVLPDRKPSWKDGEEPVYSDFIYFIVQ